MRRFHRILFNTLTVLSLVLAVGFAALWWRTRFTQDTIAIASRPVLGGSAVWLISSAGTLHYLTAVDDWRPDIPLVNVHYLGKPSLAPELANAIAKHRVLGFGIGRADPKEEGAWGRFGLAVAVPHWAVCVAFACWPALRIRTALRARRFKANVPRCPTCGYDLRATPDRCPECGTIPKGASV